MTHAKITAMLFQACPDEKRDAFAKLLDAYPFAVADLSRVRAADGGQAIGLYQPDEDQIYISPDAIGQGEYSCLCLYLHEACHAGAFSGGQPIIRHSHRFSTTLERAMGGYGLVTTAAGRDYNTWEAPERAAARQPAGLALLGVLGCAAGSIYSGLQGWQFAAGAALLGAMLIVVADHRRRRAA